MKIFVDADACPVVKIVEQVAKKHEMKSLFELGNQYVRESDWKDLALVKFCLCAMEIMIGTQVPTKHKKVVVAGALGVFVATYIPLMTKLFKIAVRRREDVQWSKDYIN